MTRQYVVTGCLGTGLRDNSIRIQRSLDQGADWGNEETINVAGVDGFPFNRDYDTTTDHITSDPSTSAKQTYAFYVRNEQAPYINPPAKRNVLYCRASLDGGASWNGEVRVFTISGGDLPPNGFAPVPPDCENPPNTLGFYRIGRVWSCVDPSGYVYVAWMDNRYGVVQRGHAKGLLARVLFQEHRPGRHVDHTYPGQRQHERSPGDRLNWRLRRRCLPRKPRPAGRLPHLRRGLALPLCGLAGFKERAG